MDKQMREKGRRKLLFKFATIFVIFIITSIVTCGIVTYLVQLRTYKELKCNEIKNAGSYLTSLIENDGERFLDYFDYYGEHYKEMRIPSDFTESDSAYKAFLDAFTAKYPGKAIYYDIYPEDLSEDIRLLYFTYVHEYWLLIFEEARIDFDLPYTYFLRMDEETHYATYQIDGERIEDEENPGFLYLGDNYYEDPDERELLWRTWKTGKPQDEYFEWNNEWGNVYSYYVPLIIDGKVLGLVSAEVDVKNVNEGILKSTLQLAGCIGLILIMLSMILLGFIERGFVYKIKFLSDKIENVNATSKSLTAGEIRRMKFGKDEIGILSNGMADMLENLEAHETKVEHAARMKSDFLANMSHEIRTPMNAVIGMTDLILREEVPEKVRNYVSQIKDSGSVLLTIINDILDFSKIESGHLDIITTEYKPVTLINDVSNIVMNRLSEKSVNLDIDLDPSMPTSLRGDENRIRQVLINLATNAVKFTNKGHISIHVNFKPIDSETGTLTVAVEDTGIGIREKDIGRLFESFSQLDSKRNRNVEGNGLGLAISKRLMDLMDGTISVESEYGVGSTFTFSLPQKIVDSTPAIFVNNPTRVAGMYLFSDEFVEDCFERDMKRLDIPFMKADPVRDLDLACQRAEEEYPGRVVFFFFDTGKAQFVTGDIFLKHKRVIPVIVADFTYTFNSDLKRLILAENPLYTARISFILNKEKESLAYGANADIRNFTAPDASVLIVDDNQVNHVITEGLLEPLNMNVVNAMSGSEAVRLAGTERFDLILMDHMMPGMDGVEAMNIIREKYPEYKDIPIIALTANAAGDAKERLLSAGMDDFVAKPIGVTTLISTIRHWLPDEKIRIAEGDLEDESEDEIPNIGDLDVRNAISMLGSKDLYFKILSQYHHFIPKRYQSIAMAFDSEDWDTYSTEVHSLKSTSGQIGAKKLQRLAASLEKAAKERDMDYIQANTQELLDMYDSYGDILAPFSISDDDLGDKPGAEKEELLRIITAMKQAADDLDLGGMERGIEELSVYGFPEEQRGILAELKEAVAGIEADECIVLLEKWEALL